MIIGSAAGAMVADAPLLSFPRTRESSLAKQDPGFHEPASPLSRKWGDGKDLIISGFPDSCPVSMSFGVNCFIIGFSLECVVFTGIIEHLGRVVCMRPRAEGGVECILAVSSAFIPDPQIGESIALDGVCLTLTCCESVGVDCHLHFDMVPVTLRDTSLGQYKEGREVHIERALRAGALIGGHFVTGHVEGVAQVSEISYLSGFHALVLVDLPHWQPGLVISKGSIAIHGVSLTVQRAFERGVECHLIPHTWEQCAFAQLSPGEKVNIEYDILQRVVVAQIGGGRE